MAEDGEFRGFTEATVRFFQELDDNNNRAWFEAHRETFESEVMVPARAFVEAMGARLKSVVPKILAVPKVNKSIFRINRDTRFSLDPSPYKLNLGLYFWEGSRPRMECPGFYFHLEPPDLMVGGGMYMFPDKMLEKFRRAAVSPKLGRELTAIVRELAVRGTEPGGLHYKRIPPGYDAAHPNAQLLLHNGIYVGWEGPVPQEFYSPALVEFCFEKYRAIVPLHRWLMKALA